MFKDLENKINETAIGSNQAQQKVKKKINTMLQGVALIEIALSPTTLITGTIDYNKQQITIVPQGNVIINQ